MGIRNLTFSINEFYHVYNRGTEKRLLFLDISDYERFVNLLWVSNSKTSIHLSNYQGKSLLDIPRGDETLVDIGAWCVMPNHFHLLLKEKVAGGLSLFMKKLQTGYSMYFNKKYERNGSLFQGKFRAKHLNSDNYLKHQYAYIHLNPIGIIDSDWKNKKVNNLNKTKDFLINYKYSSLKDYLNENRPENKILNTFAFPEYFNTSVEFEKMINDWMIPEFIKESP